jgi:hypothetical protein
MKNLWNRATQRIYEAFNGPKVRDTEFDDKVAEMTNSEKGMIMLRNVYLNSEKNLFGLRAHFLEVMNSIKNIYGGCESYEALSNEIASAHQNMEDHVQTFVKAMNDVKNMTDEWMNLFRDAKIAIEKREKDRREYEHYDEKMESVMKERAQKNNETPKELEYYSRVSIIILIYIRLERREVQVFD